MPAYFFEATSAAHKQVTALFDFIWPTATAMWNLRWQVAGYLSVLPNATVPLINARFAEGTDIHGANLKRACIDHTWDQQKEAFASILLVNVIALYEGWLDNVLNEIGISAQSLRKSLQFPERSGPNQIGVLDALASITSPESSILKAAIHPPLTQGHHYALAQLVSMMHCYRFFKELRNCEIHSGGFADQKVVDAFTRFQAVATTTALGVKEVPSHKPVTLGHSVKPSLRGVVGFTKIVLNLIVTLDAELSRSQSAENYFIRKWKQRHQLPPPILPSNKPKRLEKVIRLTRKAGFPPPHAVNDLCEGLKQWKLLSY